MFIDVEAEEEKEKRETTMDNKLHLRMVLA